MPEPSDFLTWPVAIYLATILLGQVGLAFYRHHIANATAERRRRAGLDNQVLVDHKITLETIRNNALVDAAVLLVTVVAVPILLHQLWPGDEASKGLGLTFLVLLIWVLVSGTDIGKAYLGGVAFRAYVGLRHPFQVGDRVTLMGHSGKVEEIDPFFVQISTPDDDRVSIPTAALWSAPLVSANAGERASLSVMTFHLASFVTAAERKASEDAIWNAIQRSVYWDFDKPMQIYLEHRRDEIVLTARAYVASTYNELLFKSDVYQAFLDFADRE
ncbi:MAG: mechanosensitive ion channel domain-containing protein, partial [Geminicoccaceae bacterium]